MPPATATPRLMGQAKPAAPMAEAVTAVKAAAQAAALSTEHRTAHSSPAVVGTGQAVRHLVVDAAVASSGLRPRKPLLMATSLRTVLKV